MRFIKMTPAVLATMAGLILAFPSSAETLSLECHVHWTKPGGAHRDTKRRLDIDLGAKTVRTSDDLGKGYEFKGEHPIVSAEGQRIVLEASAGKDATLDRRTGEYSFRNAGNGVTIRGRCVKMNARPSAF
jgi:hypothetical protein